jgi:MFS transporter, DHA3 family, macrolide efflux protein
MTHWICWALVFDWRPGGPAVQWLTLLLSTASAHLSIVWLAQSLSVIGSGMTGFALNVYLAQVLYSAPEQRAELALAFTLLNLGFTIPFVIGGPVAGAWADRHDRRLIMIVTNPASGLTSLLLTGHLDVWTLVCIAIVAAATSTFHYAAFDASYAMLVPDRLLSRANGMMQTTWSLAGIISPALAASIIALPSLYDLARLAPLAPKDGTALVIAIDAVTFLLCAVVLLIVHHRLRREAISPRVGRASRACGRMCARGHATSGSDHPCYG